MQVMNTYHDRVHTSIDYIYQEELSAHTSVEELYSEDYSEGSRFERSDYKGWKIRVLQVVMDPIIQPCYLHPYHHQSNISK